MPWWEDQVEPRGRVKVPVERLSFDEHNPRFTPEKRPEGDSDAAIISQLAATADLAELVQSISASGYVDIEPLIVIGRGEKLVVLEGNRRLAALRVLSDRELAASARISSPEISKEVAETLKEVSVYRVVDDSEARDLIGFKHINGPQAWDAYAKARYAGAWLDIETEKRASGSSGLSLADIAHRMGDKHDTIHRIVTAVYVLDQAQEHGLYSVDDRARKNFSFSHLYTALTYQEYREFIGMAPLDRRADPVRSPIPEGNEQNLGTLLRWLYGSKSEDIEPAIRKQNPDVARLKRVLGDPRSRRVMLERNDLDEASEVMVTSRERFEKSLVDADQNLTSAQSALDGYDGSDKTLLEIARSVRTKSQTIYRTMEATSEEPVSEEN